MAKKLVDLTQEIYNGMPVYPGHQRTAIFPAKTHEETKELNKPGMHHSTAMAIIMSDHGPTHVDSFLHMDENGEDSDQIPLEYFLHSCGVFNTSRISPCLLSPSRPPVPSQE